jgi:hypothetical protein
MDAAARAIGLVRWPFDAVRVWLTSCVLGRSEISGRNLPQPQPKPCLTYGARHFSFDLSEKGALVRLELRPVCLDESGFAAISSAAKKQQKLARFRKLSAEIDDGSCERLF